METNEAGVNGLIGKKVKCKITGFRGVVIARCEYVYGSVDFGVLPETKDNTYPKVAWINGSQLEVDNNNNGTGFQKEGY